MSDIIFWILAALIFLIAMSAMDIRDYLRKKWQGRRSGQKRQNSAGENHDEQPRSHPSQK